MYRKKKISLVFPAYNEEKNIASAIDDFRRLQIIDEIIVVNNNSSDNTARIASQKKAKVVHEKRQGYGFALRRGISEATGDYIFLCEPDGTFTSQDALRLLEFIDSFDMVIGSRTYRNFIDKKANMRGLLRWGNMILAKIIQLLYRPGCPLTDCGCTYRVMRRSVAKKISPHFKIGESFFLAELLVLVLLFRFRVKEIPVHYRARIGESKITGSLKRAVIVGLQMFRIAFWYRITFSSK